MWKEAERRQAQLHVRKHNLTARAVPGGNEVPSFGGGVTTWWGWDMNLLTFDGAFKLKTINATCSDSEMPPCVKGNHLAHKQL